MLLALGTASTSSPLQLSRRSKFTFCLCLSATVSGLVCSVYSVTWIMNYGAFEYLTVFFWFITRFESLKHPFVITSQVPVCYPVDILSESNYSLTVFRFPKINVLLAVLSLTQVFLIKIYIACNITLCPVSSSLADN